MNKIDLLHKWINEELEFDERNRLKKKRMYGHFDMYCYKRDAVIKLSKIFLNDEKVKSWDFLPLIHYSKKENKYDWFLIKKRWKITKEKEKGPPDKIKYRSICYAGHRDALLYSWYGYILNTLYEEALNDPKNNLNEVIGAYRLNTGIVRSNITLAHEVFDEIKKRENCTVLTFDIQKFYDTLDNKYLKEVWKKLLVDYQGIKIDELPEDHYAIFRSITKYNTIDKSDINRYLNNKYGRIRTDEELLEKYGLLCDWSDYEEMRKLKPVSLVQTKQRFIKKMQSKSIDNYKFFEIGKGIPQGTPISPILANIYMLEFDIYINKLVKNKGGLYRRYADDIILICNSADRNYFENEIYRKIRELKLEIQPKKTDWFEFNKGELTSRKEIEKRIIIEGKERIFSYGKYRLLQYLGFDFNGKNSYIRAGSISKYYRKMKNSIKKNIWKPFSKGVKPQDIKIEKIINNFTKERFISYVNNSTHIMGDKKILNQVRNAEKNVKKFHALSLERAKKKLFAINRQKTLKKKGMI